MKKTVLLTTAVLVVFAVAGAFAQKEKEAEKMPDPKMEWKASVDRGMALFGDPKLGTSGQTCNTCHMKGGTMDGKMGDMSIKAFDAVHATYPKYWGMAKKVMTLDQVINWCIMNPLQGKPLAWDDQKLADLAAYISTVKPMKMEKKAEEKGE
jgi:cytochrome c